MADPKIEVLSDRAALVARAAELVEAQITAAVSARGFCSLALAGGSTPKPLYETLAGRALPLEQLHLFFGDERYVPADHPDSNYRMVREAWLDPAQFPAANVHAMATDAPDPAQAAQAYEVELRRVFQEQASGDAAAGAEQTDRLPQFDIVLLGMGDDGHTASLFPQTAALDAGDRWVTVGNKGDDPRLTLTLPLLNQARTVLFLVAGASKQAALAQVFSKTAVGADYPASLIRPQGELYWLMDREAGKNF
jgi:6-phosphogluconolactonase